MQANGDVADGDVARLLAPRGSIDAPAAHLYTPASPLALDLATGAEVDFNLCGEGGVWLPARVEQVLPDGGLIIRAALTSTAEVCVPLPLGAAWARLAPAGAHTIPLLDGQQVDFLRRAAPVGASLCYFEQWQSGAWA